MLSMPTSVESFCLDKLSLPKGQTRPVPLSDILSDRDKTLLADYQSSMLLDAEERALVFDSVQPPSDILGPSP